MKNKVLVILGMHRSGTSMIAQWFHKCGLHLGDSLIGPDIGNTEGHFEDADFLQLHEKILEAHRIASSGFGDIPLDNLTEPEKNWLNALLRNKNSTYSQWGWKEPRTCLFLPFYKDLTPHAKYIIILRDFNSVVNSLIVRKFKKKEKEFLNNASLLSRSYWSIIKKNRQLTGLYRKYAESYLKAWIKFNEALLKHIQRCNNDDLVVVDYKTLISHSADVFEYITKNWLFELDYYDFGLIYKRKLISHTIDTSLFIADKFLLAKAAALETELRAHAFKSNSSKEFSTYK